jgi:hypothetical protein
VSLTCADNSLGGWRAEVTILRDLLIEGLDNTVEHMKQFLEVQPSLKDADQLFYSVGAMIGTRGLFLRAYQVRVE